MKRIIVPITIFQIINISCALEGTLSQKIIEYKERWGIYTLEQKTQDTTLIYSSSTTISNIRLNPTGNKVVFSKIIGENSLNNTDIILIDSKGLGETRLTNNKFLDTYPVWSPDGESIAYLSWPQSTLDIYIMDKDGNNNRLLYDSGSNDADIDWVGNQIAFTRNNQIWIMNANGTGAKAITYPPRAGEMGKVNLPFGDYDPRIRPDGNLIIFERLTDDKSTHGNYDLFTVKPDGTELTQITETGYTQGLASWSPSGDEILFIITAIDDVGKYDIHIIKNNGTGERSITPEYFPSNVLIHEAIYSHDGSTIYFIAEWW